MSLLLNVSLLIVTATLIVFFIMAAIPVARNRGIRHARCRSKRKLNGKTALITGASAGIGKETARDFATRGARVIMACRNIAKARIVADDIIRTSGNKNVVVYELDTSSLKSVRRCAAEVLKMESRLDILVNNAGAGCTIERKLSEEGLELTMATNHYGHFLLTNLLLGLLKKSSPARIVTVSSGYHTTCQSIDLQDLKSDKEGSYNAGKVYSKSKLCNILFSNYLARKLSGTGVTSNCVVPGMTATSIYKSSEMLHVKIFGFVANLTAKTEEEGAQTLIYAGVSEELENINGKYFDNCQMKNPSKLSEDREIAEKLWDLSVRDVKLQPHEMHF